MYTLNQVVGGLSKYADTEILIKITGWQKWVIGAGFGAALSKSTAIFNRAKEHALVQSMELIDQEDRIDVDTLYGEFKKQAQKGAITFDVPLLGAMTLSERDVDKLYEYIRAS